VLEKVAHHEDGQYEASDEQRNAEDEADGRSLTESQADDEAGNEKHEADTDAEREAVSAIKRAA